MAVLNRVQLIGHIGQEPKLSNAKDGRPYATVSLATNESFQKNDQWETVTEWHNLVFFGKLASLASRLQKGSLVFIEGKLRSNSWTDSEGAKRQSINILVQTIQFLDNVKPKDMPGEDDKLTPDDYLAQMHELVNEGSVPF